MTRDEVLEGVDNSLWFMAYSHALQRVWEATHGRRWQWARGKAPEVGVSPLVRAFWEETGIELTASCTKLCWELPPRGVFRRRERSAISHVITFVDDVAMCVPSLDTWDLFVWPPAAAMPWAATEVEQYGYHHGQAIDLGPVIPATQFRVTDEAGTYLCAAWTLVFEGSVLVYNPARDEAEWVPAHGIASDLSLVEEKSAVALANFVPRIPQEAARIARLGARHLMSWPDSSFSSQEDEEGDEQEEVEEGKQEEEEELEEQGEAGSKPPSSSRELEQGKTEHEAEPHR